ncbi:MAG: hypothetical protein ACI8TP_005118, partial [Acidimicrobiales bacterium]
VAKITRKFVAVLVDRFFGLVSHLACLVEQSYCELLLFGCRGGCSAALSPHH